MRRAASIALFALVVASTPATTTRADVNHTGTAEALDPARALAVSQQAIGGLVGNHSFRDAKGGTVMLDDLRGRPLVFSLIYTSCSDVCPMIIQQLQKGVQEAQRLMGPDRFTVLTVGIDSRNDTPMRMAAYARVQGIALRNWKFLSADEETISALARDLGFTYAASAGGYRHPSQTTIVDRDGRVYRQVYGTVFPLTAFIEPLKEAVYGTVGTFASLDGLLDRIRFLCSVYDPAQGRYKVSYAVVMAFLTGVISLGATAVVLSRAWLNGRRA